MKTIRIRCQAAKLVKYQKLKPFQDDLKELSEENQEKLKNTIIDDGFVFPIHVWEDGSGTLYTMDGHQRCKVLAELERLGYEIPPVPVAIIHADDIAEAKRFLLRSLSQYGQMTEDGLVGYVQQFNIEPEFLDELRLPEVDLDAVMDRLQIPDDPVPEDIDEAPGAPAVPNSKRGKVYILGNHRLMCGDSCDPKDVAKLMKGEKARMIFTDPPYGVSYKGVNNPNGREWEQIKNDDLRGDQLFDFLKAAFQNMADSTIDNPAIYVFHASSNQREFEEALEAVGLKVKQQIIWNKGMILGHSDYHWAHEPIFYAIKEGANCEWFGDRTAKTIQNLNRGNIEEMKKEQMQIILTHLLENTTNWEIRRDNVMEYVHPTQKPVTLGCRAIKNSSQKDEIVLDLFGGSGSTLMACEVTGRRCFTMEMDERFCDIIIKRWEDHTGKEAETE